MDVGVQNPERIQRPGGRDLSAYLCGSLRKDLVLLQHAVSIRLVGDLEEGDALDRCHFCCSEIEGCE